MVGANVRHKSFGEGVVIEQTKSRIIVRFSDTERTFIFPDIFDSFLSTDDTELLQEISRQKEGKAANTLLTIQLTPKNAATKEPEIKGSRTKKIVRSNVAFKCNYCDGGCSPNCIGYKGVCSDEMISYNIEKAKHVWCSSDSPCRRYLNGEITRTELENQFVCYESEMLVEWKASAGIVQNGAAKGKPMKLLKVQNNSLCVLTTRLPDSSDETRFIFAVFLVDESYEGDGREEGYVTNHSQWRLELLPEEARKMLFWNYYANKNAPDRIVLGSGLHRYLDDIQAAQILRDIISIKSDPTEKEFATKFFHHFCAVVGLSVEDIPQCAGALKR